MFLLAFCLALALPLAAVAQEPAPSPSPDYKALYDQANDAAARWRDLAQARERELAAMTARAQAAEARNPSEPRQHGPVAQEGVVGGNPNRAKVETNRFVLAPKQHVHLLKYGGPNEFFTFMGVDPLAIHLRIGVGDGKPVDVPVRRSFQGAEGNRTMVYGDGVGCTVFYVDDIQTPAGCGTFEADFTPNALYRQQAAGAQQRKTDGVGTISHYSGNP